MDKLSNLAYKLGIAFAKKKDSTNPYDDAKFRQLLNSREFTLKEVYQLRNAWQDGNATTN